MNKALIIALASLLAPLAAQAAEPVAALAKPAQSTPAAAAAPAPKTVAPQKTAASPTAATSQQERMRNCNKEATGKKGDERKAFMKTCLSSKS